MDDQIEKDKEVRKLYQRELHRHSDVNYMLYDTYPNFDA